MSWGYKILIVYCIFVAGIIVMVLQSSRQKTDLVTPDYYAQELQYQTRIDEARRTDRLSAAPVVTRQGDQLLISFPAEFAQQEIKGQALLYCPSDKEQDVKKDFVTTGAGLSLSIPAAHKKLYQLQLSWQAGGTAYYYENKITF